LKKVLHSEIRILGKTLTEGGSLMSKKKGNSGTGSSQGQIIQIEEAQIKGAFVCT